MTKGIIPIIIAVVLAAMAAVDNIIQGRFSKENICTVNTETEYHESK